MGDTEGEEHTFIMGSKRRNWGRRGKGRFQALKISQLKLYSHERDAKKGVNTTADS